MYKKIITLLERWLVKIYKKLEDVILELRHQLYFMDFEERESDIFIVTYLKSGTTWMQVILHNLVTEGNMDFNHIYDVSPWPKNQSFLGEPVEKINSLPEPRIIKSHDDYAFFNKEMKGKIIYVFRDGKDVAVSLYHHHKNYKDPDITFDENFEEFFTKEKAVMNWFKFNKEWLENKKDLPVLYVTYEQLKNDLDKTLERIARYLNLNLTEEIINRVKTHASFEYMKTHESKFGLVPPVEEKKVYNEFIRKGKSGEGKVYMNAQQDEFFEKKYAEYIKPFINKIESK